MIAQVIVDIPAAQVNHTFDYLIPTKWQDTIELGMRVNVPFGSRQLLGFVVGIVEESEFEGELREISAVLDYQSFLNEELIELSDVFAKKLHVFRISMLLAMLPSLLKVKYQTIVTVIEPDQLPNDFPFTSEDPLIMIADLEEHYSRPTIRQLIDDGTIRIDYQVKDKVTQKQVDYVKLLKDIPEMETILATIPERNTKQRALLQYLIERQPEQTDLSVARIRQEINVTRAQIKAACDRQWLTMYTKDAYRNPLADLDISPTKPKVLTAQQQQAFDQIIKSINLNRAETFLLEGVTGSGKTEVYLQLMAYVRDRGESAILLVPEIALTPQMIRQVKGRFGQGMAVLHSGLSDTERYDEWRRIINREATLIVGARSSIFAPIHNLGLIIIDEEHETTYKQSDNPRYHARDIAIWRSEYHQIPVVLGSATPSLESRARAEVNNYTPIWMNERTNNKPLPPVKIVDMTQQVGRLTHDMLSQELTEAISQTLARKEQIMLLLNRRGYANYLMCRECGNVVQCPRCDISLTYHKSDQLLKCHYCNFQSPVIQQCPVCGGKHLRQHGIGTQKLVETLSTIFPGVEILRMDNDTTRKKGAHDQILQKFSQGQADILVGTQMIAKGLDFERVTLVGVINADNGLNIPDFRASEKTFQLLTQVSGRTGRGALSGQVIVQTYNPDHYAIQLAKQHNYEGFFYTEMKRRWIANYPPYYYTTLISISSPHEAKAYQKAYELKTRFNQIVDSKNLIVLGPSQSGIAKINNHFYFQLFIKYKDSRQVQEILDEVMAQSQLETRQKVYISIDNEPQYFI